jgi:cytoskeleton protein RodZ
MSIETSDGEPKVEIARVEDDPVTRKSASKPTSSSSNLSRKRGSGSPASSATPSSEEEDVMIAGIEAKHELPDKPSSESAGKLLAIARTAAGLSIAEVAAQIKLAPRQIEAIESDDFASLPPRAFVRGFIRNYARLLKLDPNRILSALPAEPRAHASAAARTVETPTDKMTELPDDDNSFAHSARRAWWWIIAIIIVIIVLIGVVFSTRIEHIFGEVSTTPAIAAVQPQSVAKPAPATNDSAMQRSLSLAEQPIPPHPTPSQLIAQDASAAPLSDSPVTNAMKNAPTAAATEKSNARMVEAKQLAAERSEKLAPFKVAAATPFSKNTHFTSDADLKLVFDGESWVEVTDGKGTPLIAAMGQRGATKEVYGRPPFSLLMNKSQNVRVYYQGKAIDPASYRKKGGVSRVQLPMRSAGK